MATFIGQVITMSVKSKKIRAKAEDGTVFEAVEKVGRVTLEFDGDAVNVAELQQFINGRYCSLDIDDTQHRLPE